MNNKQPVAPQWAEDIDDVVADYKTLQCISNMIYLRIVIGTQASTGFTFIAFDNMVIKLAEMFHAWG